jgi:hypothetical protein
MLLHFLKQIFIAGQAFNLMIKLFSFGTECTNFSSSSLTGWSGGDTINSPD